MDLTSSQLKNSVAHIVARIPTSDDRKKKAVDVPSEFLSPLYSCVSLLSSYLDYRSDKCEYDMLIIYIPQFQFGEAYLRNRILSHPDVGKRWYPDLHEKYSKQVLK